jgi:hypothetical protein
METNNAIELIFTEWSSSLKNRDRSKSSVGSNFDDLFQSWKSIEADFDELYTVWLPKAIKAHLPNSSVVRNTYKKIKSTSKTFDKTEKEFIDEWNKSIEDTATSTFFEFFPPPLIDQDDAPKVYGNMSAKEYGAQRRYSEQFPTLKTDALIEQWKNQEYNLDIEDMIKNVLGNKDGNNN